MTPTTKDAYELLHSGALALATVEQNGIRIDTNRLQIVADEVDERIKENQRLLREDPIYDTWRQQFGAKTNLGSRAQLGQVIFGKMGYESKKKTSSGRIAADEESFEGIDLPFVSLYFRTEKLKKLRGTYIKGLQEETVDGFLHAFFNLHTVETMRGSSSQPNFQNIPIRDPEIGKIIRSFFIARPGRALIEIDFGALEFKIAACFWRDPGMVAYASDPKLDIHRDMASECYNCSVEQVHKDMRYFAKNRFVFPILYGSWFMPCAFHLWEFMVKNKLHLVDGTPVKKWLKSRGIKELGAQRKDLPPRAGTFEAHIKGVQDRFNKRFPSFGEGKEKWWNAYLETGSFTTMTGFKIEGVYSKNFLLNCPIQGPAFHLLLKSLILIQKEIRKRKLETLIVGQIHDCILMDAPENELQEVLHLASTTMTKTVPDMWDWIIVPISAEVDVTPVDGNWYDKAPWVEKNGMWIPKPK